MTTNAFIFSWDMYGVESIVPITQWEHWDKNNLIRLLKEEKTQPNPLDRIVHNLIMRATFNPQRHYEIYAVDCDEELDEKFWRKKWAKDPQGAADIIREHGHKLYSNRVTDNDQIRVR